MRISDWSSDGCSSDLQLFGSRHREHGSSPSLRDTGAQGPLSQTADGRRDPLCSPHDGTRRRTVRRYPHWYVHSARRRALCPARKSVVSGKSVYVHVELEGRCILLKNKTI